MAELTRERLRNGITRLWPFQDSDCRTFRMSAPDQHHSSAAGASVGGLAVMEERMTQANYALRLQASIKAEAERFQKRRSPVCISIGRIPDLKAASHR
jgi:hypothetical protein